MANEMAIRQEAGSPADYKPRGIVDIAQSSAIIKRLVNGILKKDVHYGVIPGTQKPTLFKAGAEKILSTFMISADIETFDLSTDDCIRYRVKVTGCTPDGTIVGYGIGECSTDEEKYRWKKPVCDQEWDAADPTMRREKWFKGTTPYKQKQIRTVPADLGNTILKMAKKRAMIDMTLTATAASDTFDQDLEELAGVIDITEYQKQGKPEVKQPQATGQQSQEGQGGSGDGDGKDPAAKITGGGVAYLTKQLDAKGIPHADFCTHMKVQALTDITNATFNSACAAVKKWEAAP
jgi:hypothetical protein